MVSFDCSVFATVRWVSRLKEMVSNFDTNSTLTNFTVVLSLVFCADISCVFAQAGVVGFQDQMLQIVPENTSASLPNIEPIIGKNGGFEGTAARIVYGQSKGAVRFSFRPRTQRNLVISTGMNTVEYPENSWFRQRLHESVQLVSGPVDKGSVVPMFGALYTVAMIEDDKRGGHGVSMKLQRLPHKEYRGEVRLDPYAYAITNGGWIDIPSTLVQPEILVAFDGRERCFLTIRGEHTGISQGKGRWTTHNTTQKVLAIVNKLIIVRLGQASVLFRVVSIVYPDEKARLTGWIEVRRVWPSLVPFGSTVNSKK